MRKNAWWWNAPIGSRQWASRSTNVQPNSAESARPPQTIPLQWGDTGTGLLVPAGHYAVVVCVSVAISFTPLPAEDWTLEVATWSINAGGRVLVPPMPVGSKLFPGGDPPGVFLGQVQATATVPVLVPVIANEGEAGNLVITWTPDGRGVNFDAWAAGWVAPITEDVPQESRYDTNSGRKHSG